MIEFHGLEDPDSAWIRWCCRERMRKLKQKIDAWPQYTCIFKRADYNNRVAASRYWTLFDFRWKREWDLTLRIHRGFSDG